MGVRYTRSGSGPLDGSEFLMLAREIPGYLEDEMTIAGEAGKGEAQGFVDISGTGSTWSGTFKGRSGPGPGRVDSGEMRAALDYRLVKGGRVGVGVDVGWVKFFEEYFKAQDLGFSAPGFRANSQTVQGMGLLAHLKFYMGIQLDKAGDRIIGRIRRGL